MTLESQRRIPAEALSVLLPITAILCLLEPLHAQSAGSLVAEAEGTDFTHAVGAPAAGGWSGVQGRDKSGFLALGPTAGNVSAGPLAVTFRLRLDSLPTPGNVATVDIHEANSRRVLASRDIAGRDFHGLRRPQDFTLTGINPSGGALDFRVRWSGLGTLHLDKVFARPADEVMFLIGSTLLAQLKDDIDRFKADVESHHPVRITVQPGDWKTAAEVRATIAARAAAGPLAGVVLVGPLPMHRFFMHDHGNPNPFYYEAYDVAFTDRDKDGIDDAYAWKAGMMKLWVSSIRGVIGATDPGLAELRAFFAKTRQYYAGDQVIERRSLSVAGSDWQGSAAWFAQGTAKALFGEAGDAFDGGQDTKANVLGAFRSRAYTVFRLWAHSDQSSVGLTGGDLDAGEIHAIPNKSLITFHLGCYNANWMINRAGEKNNGMSWVFGPGVGQALVGGVRSGTIYGEDKMYQSLVAGDYLGKAYLSGKTAGEAEMHAEFPDGDIVTGNLLLGNPFLQAADLTEIPAPIRRPVKAMVSIRPMPMTKAHGAGWDRARGTWIRDAGDRVRPDGRRNPVRVGR